ncbi:hypothetical protein DPEC_G00335460 [Dallia pectoralis]|uniref:Uncharacterized protein n=1 Tax=Dallia pectoralis TaxID=75939 RepID=A0ACC2F7C3_DALPE|nr:hypothetical protein DPEC_G00335460 [Dallia pectoralis]
MPKEQSAGPPRTQTAFKSDVDGSITTWNGTRDISSYSCVVAVQRRSKPQPLPTNAHVRAHADIYPPPTVTRRVMTCPINHWCDQRAALT